MDDEEEEEEQVRIFDKVLRSRFHLSSSSKRGEIPGFTDSLGEECNLSLSPFDGIKCGESRSLCLFEFFEN